MPIHTIILKLDTRYIAKLDKAVTESNGVYTSRSHLLRQLIYSNYPLDIEHISTPATIDIEQRLAVAEAAERRLLKS